MPVYRGRDVTLAALAAVVETVGPDTPIIVVDDATPEPALAEALDGLAATGRIRLLRHTRNRGFPAAVNTGIRAAAGHQSSSHRSARNGVTCHGMLQTSGIRA